MEEKQAPNVDIVLVNWNGWEDTVECLHSLQNLNYANVSVIVVDNGSTDNSVQEIKDRFNEITLIENPKNQGFAGGNNRGIAYALEHGAEYVWLLNNDTVVEEKALDALLNRMKNHPQIGICGSKLIYYNHRDTLQALGGGTYNKWLGITRNIGQNKSVRLPLDSEHIEEQLQYISGASMLLSKKFISKTGFMDEAYFLYYEEIDWAMRAKDIFRLGFAPKSIVYHKEGRSTGGNQLRVNEKSRRSDYYQIKNRLKFSHKYFPFYLPLVYLTVIYALFNRIIRGKWKRIPMIVKLMFTYNR